MADTPKTTATASVKPPVSPQSKAAHITDTTPSADKTEQPSAVDNTPSGGAEKIEIGSVEDVLNTEGTKEYKSPEENQKGDTLPTDEDAEKQPITSLAQLRDEQIRLQVPGNLRGEQRDKVKKLEEEILEEGAKHVRGSAASGEGR